MKNLMTFLALLLFAVTPLPGQSPKDDAAVRELPKAFVDAWGKRDGKELAKIMAEDVDFVTVGATWFKGRRDFELYHTRMLQSRFKESTNTLLDTRVRFLSPTIAVVRWSWSLQGDKNPDGSARLPRLGLMTFVAEKRDGKWLVVVAQNTNKTPGPPTAEMEGIESPLKFEGEAKK